VQWSKDLQQVAQLLAPLAEVVQLLGCGVSPDRAAALGDSTMGTAQTIGSQLAGAGQFARVGRLGLQAERPPMIEGSAEPGRSKGAHQEAELGTSSRQQVVTKGIEVGGRGRLEPVRHVGQAEYVDVKVAGR